MRFLADMCISRRTVIWLREAGFDAVHLRDLGLWRATDTEVMAIAAEGARIVLTMDLDFGYLLSVSRRRTPSVILFRLSDERADTVNRRLAEVVRHCADALESGAIVVADERAIRVRRLPLLRA